MSLRFGIMISVSAVLLPRQRWAQSNTQVYIRELRVEWKCLRHRILGSSIDMPDRQDKDGWGTTEIYTLQPYVAVIFQPKVYSKP